MHSFTWDDGKLQSVGGHDDTVMACWICDQACRQGAGFTYSFGEGYGRENNDDLVRDLTGKPKIDPEDKRSLAEELADLELEKPEKDTFMGDPSRVLGPILKPPSPEEILRWK